MKWRIPVNKSGLLLDGSSVGVNQILPHRHPEVWQMYLDGCANNWMPTEVPMTKDRENWNKIGAITDEERKVILRCLGFFAGSESLVSNNLFHLQHHITDPECRQYMARQMYEECLHNHTIVYVCDSLNLRIEEVYDAYQSIPSIKAKDDFLMQMTGSISSPGFNTDTTEGKKALFKDAYLYWIICEGTFFFSGFAMLLFLAKKVPGIAEQIRYTLRDESIHIKFGTYVLNTLTNQYPEIMDNDMKEFMKSALDKAVELEVQYAHDVLPKGIVGLNADMFVNYMKFIANRRMQSLGFEEMYYGATNPFPWMDEVINIRPQTNFFERTVTEYQSRGVLQDDF